MTCESNYTLLDDPRVRQPLVFVYALVFLSCVIGNVLVLMVIGSQRSMRTATNFFLANLAVGDLFVGLFCTLPNGLHLFHNHAGEWSFGESMCKMYTFTLQLGPSVSAALLILMSIERYIVVLYPISARQLLRPWVLGLCAFGAWVISCSVSVPFFVTAKYHEMPLADNDTVAKLCFRNNKLDMFALWLANFIIWYAMPLIFLAILYFKIGFVLWHSIEKLNQNDKGESRIASKRSLQATARRRSNAGTDHSRHSVDRLTVEQNCETSLSIPIIPIEGGQNDCISPTSSFKSRLAVRRTKSAKSVEDETIDSRKKVVRLLVIIVIFFAVLTLPHHVRQISLTSDSEGIVCGNDIANLFQPLSFLLLFLNSACNPFLYAFFSERFREAFTTMFSCKAACGKRKKRETFGSFYQNARNRRSDTVCSAMATFLSPE